MSEITWTGITFTGTPDNEDMRAAKYLIRMENQRRATLDPPESPLESSPPAKLKDSVLSVSGLTLNGWWKSIIEQSLKDEYGITEEQKKSILAVIRTRLDNGESASAILADISS